MKAQKVVIGLSGGVDSSVAAYVLKERGYEVIGACLKLWQSESEIEDARAVAAHLGIEFVVVDYSEKFKDEVMDAFAGSYACGRTPNPCLLCNTKVKWAGLIELADEVGAAYVATGHYARVSGGAGAEATALTQTTALTQVASAKDQTYALCFVTSDQLARTLMPLAGMTKDEVRRVATSVGLPTASKSDSMDICFVPDGDYAKFLRENYCKDAEANEVATDAEPNEAAMDADANEAATDKICAALEPGNFVNSAGEVLGTHKGIAHYTVGQRRGLGISADRSLYVIRIDAASREVVLGYEEEVYADSLIATDMNWLIDPPKNPIEVIAKIRYNHQGAKATLTPIDGGVIGDAMSGSVKCEFAEPQKAITPGQAAAFYLDGPSGMQLIGGGTIL